MHPSLEPILAALQGVDRWIAGVWLSNEHPALEGRTPRAALAEGYPSGLIAQLAKEDAAGLMA